MGKICGKMDDKTDLSSRYPTAPNLPTMLINPTVPSVDPYISTIRGIYLKKNVSVLESNQS